MPVSHDGTVSSAQRREQIRVQLDDLQKEFAEVKSSLEPKADELSEAIVEHVRQFNSRTVTNMRGLNGTKVVSLGTQGVQALKDELAQLDRILPDLVREEVMQQPEWPHRSATFEAAGVAFMTPFPGRSGIADAVATVMGRVWTLLVGRLVEPRTAYGDEFKFDNIQVSPGKYGHRWSGSIEWHTPPLKEAHERYRAGVDRLDEIVRLRTQLKDELTSLQANELWEQS